MCGRYAARASAEELVEEFEVDSDETGTDPVVPRFNLAPTDLAPVILTRVPRGEPDAGGGAAPVRQLRMLKWGLVPAWSKSASGGARMVNARAESLFRTAAYKRSALVRRCLVPADGWYEWQASPTATDRKGKPRKQPFFARRVDSPHLAFAGLYEFWKDKSLAPDDPAAWLVTFAIVTTAAEPGLDRIHERMPVVLDPERWSSWLDPQLQDPEAVEDVLRSPGPGRFEAYPVTPLVSNVRADGPELLEPADPADLAGVVDPMTGEVLG